MFYVRMILTFLILMSLTVSVEARPLEGLMPSRGVKKQTIVEKETLRVRAIKKWNEVKSSVSSWFQGVKPKTDKEIATEKRIQAELQRQKEEKERLTELKQALPEYQSQQIDGYKGYVDQTVTDISKAQNILSTSGGVAPDPSLPKTKEGVPYFLLKKVKRLPRLNIGVEPTVSADQFMVKDYALGLDKYKKATALKSPQKVSAKEVQKWTTKKIVKITEEKKLKRKEFGIAEIVTEEKIQKLTVVPKPTDDQYEDYKNFTKPELKMLAALILYGHGDKCHLVAGLFDDLSKKKAYAREANYHLGVCSVNMGFHSEAVKRLLPLIKAEDNEYAASAMETLAKTLPREYEVPFYEAIKNLKSAELVKAAMKDKIKYLQAKGAYKKGHYNAAIKAAEMVDKKSKHYPSAQFVIATSHYNRDRIQKAIDTYQSLDKLIKNSDDENLKTLVKINLARIAFQTKKYKTALHYYKKVKKTHPLWVQGLIEQGWTQIMLGDYPGAIGNMYSLHSPYFKSVYMPESWAVRTIGYLNICQYGDAYNSLTKLERNYGKWYRSVDKYIKKQKLAKNYYFTVSKYLKGDSQRSRDGLPYQVIREMARQRTYLNYQDSLNYKVDELGQYAFIKSLISKDIKDMKWRIRKTTQRIVKIKTDIAKSKKDKKLIRNLTEWKQQLTFERGLIKKTKLSISGL